MSVAGEALRAKIAGDGTIITLLGGTFVYNELVPPSHNANVPYVVFHKSSGVPRYALGSSLAFDDEIWTVKAVERNTTHARVDAIAKRLDEVLTDSTLSISGRSLLGIWRESDISFSEPRGDQQYRHSGALYRLRYE